MKNVKEIKATLIVTECPYCEYENEGFLSDPRGFAFTCEHCGKEFNIPKNVKINLSQEGIVKCQKQDS